MNNVQVHSSVGGVSPKITRLLGWCFFVMTLIFIGTGYFFSEENYAKTFEYTEAQKIKKMLTENNIQEAKNKVNALNFTHKNSDNLYVLYANAMVNLNSGNVKLAKQYVEQIEVLDVENIMSQQDSDYDKFKNNLLN